MLFRCVAGAARVRLHSHEAPEVPDQRTYPLPCSWQEALSLIGKVLRDALFSAFVDAPQLPLRGGIVRPLIERAKCQ